jgi:hypothetical protein
VIAIKKFWKLFLPWWIECFNLFIVFFWSFVPIVGSHILFFVRIQAELEDKRGIMHFSFIEVKMAKKYSRIIEPLVPVCSHSFWICHFVVWTEVIFIFYLKW